MCSSSTCTRVRLGHSRTRPPPPPRLCNKYSPTLTEAEVGGPAPVAQRRRSPPLPPAQVPWPEQTSARPQAGGACERLHLQSSVRPAPPPNAPARTQVQAALRVLDKNADGKIQFGEFVAWWLQVRVHKGRHFGGSDCGARPQCLPPMHYAARLLAHLPPQNEERTTKDSPLSSRDG